MESSMVRELRERAAALAPSNTPADQRTAARVNQAALALEQAEAEAARWRSNCEWTVQQLALGHIGIAQNGLSKALKGEGGFLADRDPLHALLREHADACGQTPDAELFRRAAVALDKQQADARRWHLYCAWAVRLLGHGDVMLVERGLRLSLSYHILSLERSSDAG